MNKNKIIIALGLMLSINAQATEKHPDDPTKIITKAEIGYVDGLSITGSIGLDQARMISARVNTETEEWRVGGSWLFDAGIVNFNFSRSDYDNDAYKNNYSIGTFVPLSVFGIEPMGIQIFPTIGYSYNDGEFLEEVIDENQISDYVLVSNSTHSGYLGAFAMKPITNELSLMGFGGGSKGSDNYSGYWFGGGASYKFNEHNSAKLFAFKTDDDFGSDEKIGIAYTYEF